MIILNPDAEEARQEEMLERVQQLLRDAGGTVSHVDDWGRRKLAYAMEKRPEGRAVVITAEGLPASLAEIQRVLSISKDVVTRSQFIRLTRREAERALAVGAPLPVDTHPEGERPSRGGGRGRREGGGGGGGGRGRRDR
ncbi:MAG: small subunit ribosomal protein [Miltoncostaeaceae bacterium]|nr:small subunit ribosomal protein [Miltoncostaeaceae bacterium]